MEFTSKHTHSDQYLDLKGLSEYCSISVSSLRNHIKKNYLPHFLVKGKTLVKRSEFDRWMENFRGNPDEDLKAIAEDVIRSLKSD